MHPTVKAARTAGVFYLLLGLVGPINLIYAPSRLYVEGNALATAQNLAAHQMLVRIAIVSDLLTGLLSLMVAFALYRLFKRVDQNLSVIMVVLGGLMVTPIFFINSVNEAAAMMFARGADFLSVFDASQRAALAMVFFRLHGQGDMVNQIFWGLWLFPFGLLVYRSRFIPRFLGVWLLINGFAYVVMSLTGLLMPQYAKTVAMVATPALLGEPAIVLWLLIKGARVRELPAPPSEPVRTASNC